MITKRLSLLLALALVGSLVALSPASAEHKSQAAEEADAPLACTSELPEGRAKDLRRAGNFEGKVLWCGGQVRDQVGGDTNGLVESFDESAQLDVDVTLPAMGPGPWPLIVMLHGLGGSRDNNWSEAAGYAARGYAVLDYTARGYWENTCETGLLATTMAGTEKLYEDEAEPNLACRTQLASRRHEIKDTQHLAGRLVDGTLVDGVTVAPQIGVLGRSYGGGQTWMLTRDNSWRSPEGRRVRVAAAVPIIGWTDLLDALLPNGRATDVKSFEKNTADRLDQRRAERIGVLKESYASTFYMGMSSAAKFKLPGYLNAWYESMLAGEPYTDAANPVMADMVDELLRERSALFMPMDAGRPAILSVQGFTDGMFPASQALNMYNLLNKNRTNTYPMNMYFGDYGHPVAQGKKAERAYVDGLIEEWFDHYLVGRGKAPKRSVEVHATRCDDSSKPGPLYSAKTFKKLQQGSASFDLGMSGALDTGADDVRARVIKPIDTDAMTEGANYAGCRVTRASLAEGNLAGATDVLSEPLTMLGLPTVSLTAHPELEDMYISARLWDVDGDERTLVDRGVFRLQSGNEQSALFKLFGNAYTFAEGHSIELELTANDSRSFLESNAEGTIAISDVSLSLPLADPNALPDVDRQQ